MNMKKFHFKKSLSKKEKESIIFEVEDFNFLVRNNHYFFKIHILYFLLLQLIENYNIL
jgi:hypothetical protein